jgi:hypothetical protein
VSLSISSGSPVVYAIPRIVSAFRISRTLTSGSLDHLSPFAMWWASPISDYYGDSVTMGLAPVRPSHVPLVLNVSSVTEAPHSSPSMKSFFIAPPVGGGRSRKLNDPPLEALRSDAVAAG